MGIAACGWGAPSPVASVAYGRDREYGAQQPGGVRRQERLRARGGMHVAAIRRNIDSYQHIDPALVGNEMRILVSDLSGRGNMLSKAENTG